MGFLFNVLIYQPLYNLLIFVYNVFPFSDFGIAIIIVTILIKLFLIPLSRKQIESQKKMQELQPKIKEIQERYKNDKEKQSRALMEFYKINKTNPFSGCLPTIIQLIFLIAIYRVLFNISNAGLKVDGEGLYAFIFNPGQINHLFLGIMDLSRAIDFNAFSSASIPQVIVVFLAAVAQYFQTKMLMAKNNTAPKNSQKQDVSQIMMQQMLYLGPLLTLFIGMRFPAGLALYWLVSTAFSVVQQYLIIKKDRQIVAVSK